MHWGRIAFRQEIQFAFFDEEGFATLVTGSPFTEWKATALRVPMKECKLLAPVIPPTFYACGVNYAGHAHHVAEEFSRPLETLWPKGPEIGYRAQSAIIGPGETIVIPADAPEPVQCEGELAVVIGRRARRVSAANALDFVFGYTIANDVSVREWQFIDRTFWRSKNADTFKPLGPWIRTDVDLDKLTTRISVNGEKHIEFSTNAMLYSVAEYIAAITKYITLHPGDVIIMGTDGASPRVGDGDVISIEISGIGCLSNPVVRERKV